MAPKITRESEDAVWNQMYYVMGLNVKEFLVILKCPKRGAFLLTREKLKNNKHKLHRGLWINMEFITPQTSIHISQYLCFIISWEWVVIIIGSSSEIRSTFLLLSFDIFPNVDGDISVSLEQIVIFFEFYFITDTKTLNTCSYLILHKILCQNTNLKN